jgi:hypothetical protein
MLGMRRLVVASCVAAMLLAAGWLVPVAEAHDPFGRGCRPGVGYGVYRPYPPYGAVYGPVVGYRPYIYVSPTRPWVPYGAGYVGGWQPYQGFYFNRPQPQVGLYFGF